jgi:hypothetical protein
MNQFEALQDRAKRLLGYMENGPEKYINLSSRIMVDWVRVQPDT